MNIFFLNIRFIFESTSMFTIISSILLLIATCYVAKKCPAKLHSIGMITIIWGLLCFSVSLSELFSDYIFYEGEYYSGLFELLRNGSGISYQDLESGTVWQGILPSMCNSCTILLWSSLVYMISRILYIIRTPRI